MISFHHKGKVIDGEKLGRTIGFPTANLDQLPDAKELQFGVYLATCQIANQKFNALAYFGPKLAKQKWENVFEVFIIDFDQLIYDQVLEIELLHFIRSPIKFESVSQLRRQLNKDLEQAKKIIDSKL